MKKRILSMLLGGAMIFSLTACSGGEEAPTTGGADAQQEEVMEPVDLTGTWEMTNGNASAEASMKAEITGERIEVVWVMEGESSGWDEWLYWSGSYVPATEPGDAYTWVSETDGKAATAILGSSAETKEFEYKDGVLYFDVTMQGETVTAEMERIGDVEPEKTETASEVTAGPLPTEGDVADYHVVLHDYVMATDYNGNDMMVITYDFTNNSEDTTNASIALYFQAFQDGVELEHGYGGGCDYGIGQKDIRPGVTLEGCQVAFALSSESPVEVEVSNAWDDPTVGKIYEVAG